MPVEYDYLSIEKRVALAVVGTTSSLLSIYGSITIMYLVLLKKWKKKNGGGGSNGGTAGGTTAGGNAMRRRGGDGAGSGYYSDDDVGLYHRIVFGLSLTDLITTLALMVSDYANRSDTNLPFAFGNESTCEWSAFFLYFWLGSYIYSAELSLFFLLVVRYNMREEDISRRFEPYLHILPFLAPLAFNSVALPLNMFYPSLLFGVCELAPSPGNCVGKDNIDECEKGSLDDPLSYAHALVGVSAVITGLVSTWLLYWTVLKQTRRNRRYSVTGQVDEQQHRRARAVAMQAVWYTVAFLNGFIVVLFVSIIGEVYTRDLTDTEKLSDNVALYVAIFLVYLFFPLQGFFNWYIYIRPRLIRWKDANPSKSWFWSYRMVLTGNHAPSTPRTDHLTSKLQSQPPSPPPSAMAVEDTTKATAGSAAGKV